MSREGAGFVMQSVDRALAILLVLARGPEAGLPLAEISRALGLNQSTCHHLLATLKARRFVEQDPVSRRYRLGIKAVEVGQAAVQQVDLARVALPHMEQLMRAAQENVNLVILEDDSAVYVAQVPCDRTVRMFTRIGERAPLHCTGVGKVLLAYLPAAERADILARTGLKRFTPATICDPAALAAELEKVKAQGYALDREERERDVACLAAPVRDYRGRVVAALSVSAPASRLGPARQAEILPRLLEKAAAIARDLGWNG
ncbi:IclR family transcriptional regulator [Gelria sp. Kuro-4]|nr:IclR family transcriptional regulator [Gelria sp. Kuro-4]